MKTAIEPEASVSFCMENGCFGLDGFALFPGPGGYALRMTGAARNEGTDF